MNILLLGKNGQLGWELNRTLAPIGNIFAIDYPEIDLAKANQIKEIVQKTQPDIIVNATAYTAVDRAESERGKAMRINAEAPGVLAALAAERHAAFIHYSTDYVFDGTKGSPYIETDIPNPLNVYGESKLAGEQKTAAVNSAYLILRTSWVYSMRRDCFVTRVLRWSREKELLRMVTDQIGNPTWARMLAEISSQLLAKSGAHPFEWIKEHKGIYHLAGNGFASKYHFARTILQLDSHKEEQTCAKIQPALTSDFPSPAQRPHFAALDTSLFAKTFDLQFPPWEESLKLALEECYQSKVI